MLVILIDPGAGAVTSRLREELESLGMQVLLLPPPEPGARIEERAWALGAVAAIRITPAGPGTVELSILDRATGKTVIRSLNIATPTDPAAAELIALRTAELLRASLMELQASHPPRGDVRSEPELRALRAVGDKPAASGSLWVRAGPTVSYGVGLGPALGMGAGLGLVFGSRLGLTLQTLQPLVGHELSPPEGQISILGAHYRLGAALRLDRKDRRLGTEFDAGLALVRLVVAGRARTPFVGVREEHLLWGPWAGAGLRLQIASRLGLVGSAEASFAFPRLVVRATGRELASWGRPLATGLVALDCTW